MFWQHTHTYTHDRLLLASLPYMGFGSFVSDGLGVSCTFDFVNPTPMSKAYVLVITTFGFIGESCGS